MFVVNKVKIVFANFGCIYADDLSFLGHAKGASRNVVNGDANDDCHREGIRDDGATPVVVDPTTRNDCDIIKTGNTGIGK